MLQHVDLNFDKRLGFALICLLFALINYFHQEVLITDEMYYSSLGSQITMEKIDDFLRVKEKWMWLNYASIPVIYLIKFTLITTCILTGAMLLSFKVGFKRIFETVMIAELIFVVPAFIKIFWFLIINQDYTLEEVQFFSPLSLLNVFNASELDRWWVYPLQLLNIFEVLYWLVLAFFIHKALEEAQERRKPGYQSVFMLVLSSYGIGLLSWVVIVVFLQVSLT